MGPTARFVQYAWAFEQTYDDDWGRLERFFASDAVYWAQQHAPELKPAYA